jgi:hypothetical protein
MYNIVKKSLKHCHNSAGVVSTSKVCTYTMFSYYWGTELCSRMVRRPAMLTEIFLFATPVLQESDRIGIGNITNLGMYSGRSHNLGWFTGRSG